MLLKCVPFVFICFATLPTLRRLRKFQLDTLASLVRYYKTKASQHRSIFEKLKSEHQELKVVKKWVIHFSHHCPSYTLYDSPTREVEELRYENQQLRQYMDLNEGDPLDPLNQNGKRSRTDAYRFSASFPQGVRR